MKGEYCVIEYFFDGSPGRRRWQFDYGIPAIYSDYCDHVLLMIRPQMKKQKERQKMVDALQKGDKIITTGGMHGKITGFTEDGKTVIVQIDDKVKVNIERSAVNVVKGK